MPLDLNDVGEQRPEAPLYDLDELSDGLAACAPDWVRKHFPNGLISKDGKEVRCANIHGRRATNSGFI